MARSGDSYIVSCGSAHRDWGIFRNPTNRSKIQDEGYIQIPKDYAREYEIYNSNYAHSGFGYNMFYASSADGYLNNEILLAQGCSGKGDIYAKQFSVKGNLKVIGKWYKACGADADSRVRVTWMDETHILLELI